MYTPVLDTIVYLLARHVQYLQYKIFLGLSATYVKAWSSLHQVYDVVN